PQTGEFISKNIALIGMGMVVLVFFYLRKNRRKRV
ncbi:MAG: LPXTG cell wall anchor domain-containing protein, partial [Enterococcus sp.]